MQKAKPEKILSSKRRKGGKEGRAGVLCSCGTCLSDLQTEYY